MGLIKTSLLNAIAVIVKILTALGLNKVLAIYVGPSGYALIGQFQQALVIVSALAGQAIQNGVTKYTAEYGADQSAQNRLWSTAFVFGLGVALLCGVALILFSRPLSIQLLGSDEYQKVFFWLAAALPLLAINSLGLAVLNGRKEVVNYVSLNIALSILGAAIASLLAMWKGLYGALVALAISQAVVGLLTIAVLIKKPWFQLKFQLASFNVSELRKLLGFGLMALVGAMVAPAVQIAVRNFLIETQGASPVGQWHAVTRISDVYLMFITTTLSVYLLPRVSETKSWSALKREMIKVYQLALPAAFFMAVAIYLLRFQITPILFDSSFVGMEVYYPLQLLADFLKIGSWVLGFVMLGKAMVKWYVLAELLFGFSFLILGFWLGTDYGIEGVLLAQAINSALFWLYCWLVIVKDLPSKMVV